MNPKRIQHGNRTGIEIKKFDQATESMQYGNCFSGSASGTGFWWPGPPGILLSSRSPKIRTNKTKSGEQRAK
jgi:hypothetical protein